MTAIFANGRARFPVELVTVTVTHGAEARAMECPVRDRGNARMRGPISPYDLSFRERLRQMPRTMLHSIYDVSPIAAREEASQFRRN